MKQYLMNEKGVVSLLTTVFIGVVLSIVTVALVSQMVSELRQAGDAEQSERAYYAAVSGVEDAVAKVSAAISSGIQPTQECGSAGSSNLNLDPSKSGAVGWTCQRILYSGSPSGTLNKPGQAVQIDTTGARAFNSVVLEWDLSERPPSGWPAGFFSAPVNFPAASAGWNHPAAIEMTFVEIPKGPFAASATAIKTSNALVRPTTSGLVSYNYNNVKGTNAVTGSCNAAAGSYHCKVIFDHFNPSRDYMFRLRTYYVGTSYKLTFTAGNGGSGLVVSVPDGNAMIDVTGKAGQAYRRVIYKVPFADRTASGLNYVIYSGSDICKNFTVFEDSTINGGCPY